MASNLPLKTRVSLTLDEDVVERIRDLSDDAFRSFSQYVNLVLHKHIDEIDKGKDTSWLRL